MYEVSWCAICKYETKEQFLFGNVVCEDSYQVALDELTELWNSTFPFEPPSTFDPVRGVLVFTPVETDNAGVQQ